MKRTFLTLAVSVFAIVGVFTYTIFADETAITNAEFADLLVKTLGIELPAGSENLSDAEYYEVIANIFAARDLVYFVNANPNDPIIAGNMAGILYALIGGTGEVSADEVIQFLVDNGYITPINANSMVSLAYATEALNNPEFTDAVAEAFLPAGPDRVGLEAPGYTLEDTPGGSVGAPGTTTTPPATAT